MAIASDFAFGDANPLMAPSSIPLPVMAQNDHSSHPNFAHLTLLVFEAVLEVVCVSLPGYIVARMGMFDASAQKFVANLNMTLFTPCLIFSKLASQLDGEILLDLVVIPFILLAQTLVSWLCAQSFTRLFRMRKAPQKNFIVAMAVFGNSNSLPLSLVLSLSHTISGLHWDKIPGDNDGEVAARGILYLLIFSQLGQAVRWSWGMNSLLKPLDQYSPEERQQDLLAADEEDAAATNAYKDNDDSPTDVSRPDSVAESSLSATPSENVLDTLTSNTSSIRNKPKQNGAIEATRPQIPPRNAGPEDSVDGAAAEDEDLLAPFRDRITKSGLAGWIARVRRTIRRRSEKLSQATCTNSKKLFRSLPTPAQKGLSQTYGALRTVTLKIYSCLNVPLAAIIVSVVVAIVPSFKAFFFTPGTFVNNSVTRAIQQSGNVAVPLILVVLGANLARNTLPQESKSEVGSNTEQSKMLYLSLICRMLIPTIVMAPILALLAKYVPVSILDDPIFVIVCFLLTGAPSALQLAQMCQVNGVFVGTVSRLLFHSYVIWILPSTLVLVMLALEVVEWAA